ncbi:hypothetical protein LWI28_007606 [Acer negundo]|uniref:Magnesium transporter CorA-like family protein n=1 Tax=Acer negundo TaxID=4023 RepID=A0AAD5ISZ4_ACENE|nr:hypothetical protein LWI28_007606 [Acer negundo]
MSDLGVFMSNGLKKQENHKNHFSRDVMLGGGDLWTDGLICAFEFVRSRKKTTTVQSKSGAHHLLVEMPKKQVSTYDPTDYNLSKSPPIIDSEVSVKDMLDDYNHKPGGREEALPRSYWVPIGWDRISELVRSLQVDAGCWEPIDFFQDEEDDVTVEDLAAPYWERPVGPTWWCHVAAAHPFVNDWLRNAQWIHPAICIALRDESKLISERMKHLLYEVPVRVAGGLLFELLGQSAGDPLFDEDDIPIVLRSWQAQNFLVTALHVKGSASNINVLGITEVQELLAAGGNNIPRTIHEVIAYLASRLARWDDRLFRKSIFGAADAVELKFMNRRNQEDMHLFSIILNQEIKRLSTQVIRVKWSLHAREEIVFELLQHLRGNLSRVLLEGIRKTTREMIQEQEAVRGRLFTIQDVMQSTVRAWLQDRSLTVTHNLGVFGGCGLILSIITGLFGINVDGIPGNPIKDEHVEVRKLELEELVRMFQQEAESHAQLNKVHARDLDQHIQACLVCLGQGKVLDLKQRRKQKYMEHGRNVDVAGTCF